MRKFNRYIASILAEPVGGGQFSETVSLPDGGTVTFTFPLAVAHSWLTRSGRYRSNFGPLPAWVLLCHPYHRTRLCDLALREAKALPPAMPTNQDDRPNASDEPLASVGESSQPGRPRTAKSNPLYESIRKAVSCAAAAEGKLAPFKLSGRGGELRVTLDRRMAAIMRGIKLPTVTISGYGANIHYPNRVFERAANALRVELGKSPFSVSDGKVYWAE